MTTRNGAPDNRTTSNSQVSTQLSRKSGELQAKSNALKTKSDELWHSRAELNLARFLKTDLQVALTFTKIALETSNAAKRQRTQKKARVAYDAVQRHLKGAHLNDADNAEIQSRLGKVKAALERLGQPV